MSPLSDSGQHRNKYEKHFFATKQKKSIRFWFVGGWRPSALPLAIDKCFYTVMTLYLLLFSALILDSGGDTTTLASVPCAVSVADAVVVLCASLWVSSILS